MISIEDQLKGMKMLDKAYEQYQKDSNFTYTNMLYEYGFSFLRDVIGMKKLIEISEKTSGTKETIRKEHILYLFKEKFDKNG